MSLVQEVTSNASVQEFVITNEELINQAIETYLPSIVMEDSQSIYENLDMVMESGDLEVIHYNVSSLIQEDINEFLGAVSIVVGDSSLTQEEKKDCIFNIEEAADATRGVRQGMARRLRGSKMFMAGRWLRKNILQRYKNLKAKVGQKIGNIRNSIASKGIDYQTTPQAGFVKTNIGKLLSKIGKEGKAPEVNTDNTKGLGMSAKLKDFAAKRSNLVK